MKNQRCTVCAEPMSGKTICECCGRFNDPDQVVLAEIEAPLWPLILLVVFLIFVGLAMCALERRASGQEFTVKVSTGVCPCGSADSDCKGLCFSNDTGDPKDADCPRICICGIKEPWLPETEQRAVRRMIPVGVPVGTELKFYRLSQVYQSLYTMNGGQPHRDVLPVRGEDDPWRLSGGMTNVDRGLWRNVTGLSLPAGRRILVWEEWQDVGAFGPVPKVRWRFPDGTLAYDVLLRRTGDGETAFEVRIHRKRGDEWDGGTRYAPVVEEEGEGQTYQWSFDSVGIACRSTATTAKLDMSLFEPTRRVHVQYGVTPHGYLGAGTSCNTCHDRVGESTGYASGRRGDDGRFSWHPFDKNGKIDSRWPIERK